MWKTLVPIARWLLLNEKYKLLLKKTLDTAKCREKKEIRSIIKH